MWTGRLERHDERLPAGVHHGVRDLEGPFVDGVDDPDTDGRAGQRAGIPPYRYGVLRRRDRDINVQPRIANLERWPVRRHLAPGERPVRGLVAEGGELGAEVGLKGGQPLSGRCLAIDPR